MKEKLLNLLNNARSDFFHFPVSSIIVTMMGVSFMVLM